MHCKVLFIGVFIFVFGSLSLLFVVTIMKSTKVQHPRHIPLILLAEPHSVAVFSDQLSLLCGLSSLVCLVWGKAERTTQKLLLILPEQSSMMP